MLDDLQLLRVTGAKLDDLHKGVEVPQGQHAVDAEIRLRITGVVQQGAEQLVAPDVKIPLTAVLALVAERLGVRAEQLFDMVLDAAVQAHERGDPVSQWMDVSQRALSEARAKVLARMDKVPKRGPLRKLVEINEIEIHGAGLAPLPAAPKRRRRATA
jgi:hypothetical protein